MSADFALMVVQAQLAPVVDVLAHARPHEFTRYCFESGFGAEMSETMDGVKHFLTPRYWNERSGMAVCCIA